MKNVNQGETFCSENGEGFFCILGSCVGLLVISKEKVCISHGRNPVEVKKQIKDLLTKNSDYSKIILLGGMNKEKADSVGSANIKAAEEELEGIKHENKTGYAYTIKFSNKTLTVKKVKN